MEASSARVRAASMHVGCGRVITRNRVIAQPRVPAPWPATYAPSSWPGWRPRLTTNGGSEASGHCKDGRALEGCWAGRRALTPVSTASAVADRVATAGLRTSRRGRPAALMPPPPARPTPPRPAWQAPYADPGRRVASGPLPPGAAALRCAAVTGDTHLPPVLTAWMSQPCCSYDVDVASTPYDLARGGARVTGARCRVLAAEAAAKAEWH